MRLQSVFSVTWIFLFFSRIPTDMTSQEFHHINKSMTWHEAQSFCRLKYTDLATVDDSNDNNRLIATLATLTAATHVWIGLHVGPSDAWMWSNGRGKARYTFWETGEPNNIDGSEYCADMMPSEKWQDVPCDEVKGFVCYKRLNASTIRFVYYTQEKSWFDSQKVCRRNHDDMAYITSEKQNSFIAKLISNSESGWTPSKRVWIGLFRDQWTWSDGSETSFRSWLNNAELSRGDCASVSQEGRWVEDNCYHKKTFVCQGGLKVRKTVIKMRIHSTVDLNDSTVQESLLNKLATNLRSQNVTDLILSWRRNKDGLVFQREEQEVPERPGC